MVKKKMCISNKPYLFKNSYSKSVTKQDGRNFNQCFRKENR